MFLGMSEYIYSMDEPGKMNTLKAFAVLGVTFKNTPLEIVKIYRNKCCTEPFKQQPILKKACECLLNNRTMISNTFSNLKKTGDRSGVTKFLKGTSYWQKIPWYNYYHVYTFNKINPNGLKTSVYETTFAHKAIKVIAAATAIGLAGFGVWQLLKSHVH